MKNMILIGGLGAFVTGLAIALQSYLSGRAGNIVGPIKTGLWTNFLGGSLAGIIILVLWFLGKNGDNPLTRKAVEMVIISGALGIFIIMGISYSIMLAGVTAGIAAVFLGQMFLGVIADSVGWGGVDPIPLDFRRIAGLVIMAVAVYLLLPKK